MNSEDTLPKRERLRLTHYDYSCGGFYFVTVCTKDKKHLFGEVRNGGMELNEAGKMIELVWREIANKFPFVQFDYFTIMPNHIHGIIQIVGADLCVRPLNLHPRSSSPNERTSGVGPTRRSGPTHRSAPTLGRVMQWFKTISINYYIHGIKNHGWRPFKDKLWQRGYYDHVIRHEGDLNRVRQYSQENPLKWKLDPENQERKLLK